MIRTGFSSPLRSLVARQVRPSPSPLSRPFSLSSPSLADGLFPDHGKQHIKDVESVPLNTVDPASIPAPDNVKAIEDGSSSSSSSLPPSEQATSSSASTTPSTSSSVDDAPSQDPTSSSSSSSSTSPSSSAEDSSSSSNLPSSPSSSSSSPSPFQPLSLLPDALQEARRNMPSRVSPLEWRHLKGPRPTLKTIRLSLKSSKNNTHGLLSWAYDPSTVSTPEKWNYALRDAKFTGGSLGFKGANSGTSEAGHQVVVNLFRRVREENDKALAEIRARQEESGERRGYLQDQVGVHVTLNLNGFGQGRQAFDKALRSEEGAVVRACAISLTDKTPIRRAWNRAPHRRRV